MQGKKGLILFMVPALGSVFRLNRMFEFSGGGGEILFIPAVPISIGVECSSDKYRCRGRKIGKSGVIILA